LGQSGIINYKHGEPFLNNERCTWTVYADGAATIEFNIESNGIIQSVEDYLRVGFFLDADYKTERNFQEVLLYVNEIVILS